MSNPPSAQGARPSTALGGRLGLVAVSVLTVIGFGSLVPALLLSNANLMTGQSGSGWRAADISLLSYWRRSLLSPLRSLMEPTLHSWWSTFSPWVWRYFPVRGPCSDP